MPRQKGCNPKATSEGVRVRFNVRPACPRVVRRTGMFTTYEVEQRAYEVQPVRLWAFTEVAHR